MIHKKKIKSQAGVELEEYTLKKPSGAALKVLNYGGIVSSIQVPDANGKLENVCLGFDDPCLYLNAHPCFGALVGRVANRIAKGRFSLDGVTYQLPINNGLNTLHGGTLGFDKVFWKVDMLGEALHLTHVSPDGDQGFPGNLKVEVIYEFSNDHVLSIQYKAQCDKATPINLTHHAYYNLEGAGKGDVLEHQFEMTSQTYTPVDESLIPTGQILETKNTEFDFAAPTSLRTRFERGVEYDHNLILKKNEAKLQLAAKVYEPKSGRRMEMWTTEPAFQFYTANFLDGSLSNSVGVFDKWGGFCLEAQNYPDAVNHPNFPNSILRPKEVYTQRTEYRFS